LTVDILKLDDIVTKITVQDEMTIYTVLEHKNTLLPQLKEGHELQLDLSKVSEMDSAGAQLLIFMKQESLRLNNHFTLVHHSEAAVEVIELLNLSAFFGDPVVIPADWSGS